MYVFAVAISTPYTLISNYQGLYIESQIPKGEAREGEGRRTLGLGRAFGTFSIFPYWAQEDLIY